MIESPLINELMAEYTQEMIVVVLEARFGTLPETLSARIKSVSKKKMLQELIKFAAQCPGLAAFEAHLPVERPQPSSSRKTPRRRKNNVD